MSPPAQRTVTVAPWRDRYVILALVGGLISSFVVFAVARRYDQHEARTHFADRSKWIVSRVERDVVPAVHSVESLSSFLSASEEVTAEEFVAFTRPALRHHVALAALEWAPRVADSDREDFEAADGGLLIREPDDEGGMTKAPKRSEYFPIRYMVPQDDGVMGLDVAFEAGRRGMVDKAIDAAKLSVSGRLQLVEDPDGVHSVTVYAPVFETVNGGQGGSPTRDQLRGLAIGLIRIEPLLKHSVDLERLDDVAVLLIDADAQDAERQLFASTDGAFERLDGALEDERYLQTFEVGGRQWTVACVALAPHGSKQPLALLLISLTITLIASGGFAATRHIARLRKAAERGKRLGQYQLTERLGQGGMGEVYRAQHAMLRRETAIKLIRPEVVGEQTLLRFEREVHAASDLRHPNAITVYDFGRTPSGALYYAMELLEGIDLDALVRETGALPQARVVHLLIQACGALGEAHAHGLVHRDVKPGNMMVCRQGGVDDFVKVLDFGLVKVDEPLDGNPNLSANVEFLGTPYYMAPEQIVSPSEVDARADVYALGGVAYFLLCGIEVFTGASMTQLISKCLTQEPKPPSARAPGPLDPELEALILSCLAKEPEKRPADANALRRALQRLRNVPAWTEADAAQWWMQQGTDLLAKRSKGHDTQREHLSVELDERQYTAPVPPSMIDSATIDAPERD